MLYLLLLIIQIQALNNGLFQTPPMGWISWQRFRCNTDCKLTPQDCINEELFKSMADRMISDGWKELGYNWINIDDCWSLKQGRDKEGKLQGDPTRFPSGMKALADYIHSKGLKFGLYSDVGVKTCAGYPASFGHYQLDAQTFADWGVDSLKFDGCYMEVSNLSHAFAEMSLALNKTSRPIAYICVFGPYYRGKFDHAIAKQYCNQWRTWLDVDDSWDSVNAIIDYHVQHQDEIAPYAGPGGYNDPDMLIIGGYGLTTGQSMIQMVLWSIMAAPLLMGNDLRHLTSSQKAILQNKDIIAVNQDPLGIQGKMIYIIKDYEIEIWTRPLQYDQLAVAIVRRKVHEPYFPINITITWDMIQWNHSQAFIQDLIHSNKFKKYHSFQVAIHPIDATIYRFSSQPFEASSSLWLHAFMLLLLFFFLFWIRGIWIRRNSYESVN